MIYQRCVYVWLCLCVCVCVCVCVWHFERTVLERCRHGQPRPGQLQPDLCWVLALPQCSENQLIGSSTNIVFFIEQIKVTSYRMFQKTQLFWSWNLKFHLLTYYKDNWFHPTILKISEVKKIAFVRNTLYVCVCVHVCVYCICCVRVGVCVRVFDYTGLGCIWLRSCVQNCRMWVCLCVSVWVEWSCDDNMQRILVIFLINSE